MTKKSRFGCQTCKIRKVKCDETQPSCNQCTTTGRRCDGPPKNKTIFVFPSAGRDQRLQQQPFWLPSAPTPSSRSVSSSPFMQRTPSRSPTQSPSAQLSPIPDLQDDEKRALSFFISNVGPTLGGELNQDFWRIHVSQLCHSNPFVRTAVFAVSTLYEHPVSNPLYWPTSVETNFTHPQHLTAFRWYNQSLKGISNIVQHAQTPEQVSLALTSCLLFACVESQQLNAGNSMQLMLCGFNLLKQANAVDILSGDILLREVLLPIFTSVALILVLHGYSLPGGWFPTNRGTSRQQGPILSTKDARTRLDLLMIDALLAFRQASSAASNIEVTEELRYTQKTILENLKEWHYQLDVYLAGNTDLANTITARDRRITTLLHVHYLVAYLWALACLDPTETIFDSFSPEYVTILDRSETFLLERDTVCSYTYTFEARILTPLLFVAWKCRVPSIRRRALKLLRRAPIQESHLHRDVHLQAMRKILEVEERLESFAADGGDIEAIDGVMPSTLDRIKDVLIHWDQTKGTGSFPMLVYSRFEIDENGQRGFKRHVVPI